jgi:hypothetical protein
LEDSRRRGTHNSPEQGATDIAIYGRWSEELRVVESVERFQPDLKGFGFGEPDVLEECQVEIVDPRAVEEAPRGAAKLTQGWETEERGVECCSSIAWIRVDLQITGSEIRRIHAIVIDPIGDAA